MKLRLTPLNIVSSVLLVLAASSFLNLWGSPMGKGLNKQIVPYLLLLFVITSIADFIFRHFVKDLKRIWVVEVLFIIFAVILTLAFHSSWISPASK